jgi:hypothetical protein
MSQSGILSDSTTSSSDVEFLTGDSGGAVGPDGANNINVLGGTNITTVGVPGSNSITINQDNVIIATGTTVGAVTIDLITFDAGAVPGCYQVEMQISAFESTTPAGAAYVIYNGVRTTGAATTLTGICDQPGTNEEAALIDAETCFVVSGNNIISRVTGIAGLTINWYVKMEYVFIS